MKTLYILLTIVALSSAVQASHYCDMNPYASGCGTNPFDDRFE